MAHDDYGGLEYGILQRFPPVHANQKPKEDWFGFEIQQSRPHWMKAPPAAESINPPSIRQDLKWRSQRPKRAGNELNWATGGPGMQAVFLGSKQKSFGTGVFLPRRADTDFQFTNKPAFSPVLLPARVIQTLNLNVHELGSLVKQDQPRNVAKKTEAKLENTNKADGVYYSPEIFLPKEWTY